MTTAVADTPAPKTDAAPAPKTDAAPAPKTDAAPAKTEGAAAAGADKTDAAPKDAGTALGGDPAAAEAAASGKKTDPPAEAGKDGAKKDGAATDKKDQPQGAPEKYQDFKLPEGMKLEAAAMESFQALAKKLNLPQEAAQEGLDFYTKIVAQEREAGLTSFNELKTNWLEESKKAFGNTFEADIATASKAIERFGPPDLKKVLNDSGLGNHPALLKFAHAVGKAISEDKFVEGSGRETPKSDAELFGYDKSMAHLKK